MGAKGSVCYGEDPEGEVLEYSGGGGAWEFIEGDGGESGYGEGGEIYHQRIGIVEPVFANIRAVKGLDRFTLRGKLKVNIQWMLYCVVHNIGKIMSYRFA